MRAHPCFVLLLTIFLASPVLAQSQREMNQAAGSKFATADAELNRVYKEILRLYKDKPAFIEKLRVAQRAWIKFRDAELEALYPVGPDESAQYLYGSVFPMCWAVNKESLTRARTSTLRQWLKGTEEGDVCSGSVKLDREFKELQQSE